MGFRMMSTGVPSDRNGISSSGRMRDTTPLLPCRPAILSPTEILRVCATHTRMASFTSGGRLSSLSRLNCLTPMTLPRCPCGTRSEVSRTSLDFSPKMARSSRSSAVISVSPLGVTLPTRMSFSRTSAPIRTIPLSSRSRRFTSPTLGMSRVISSVPSFVVRLSTSYFSICTEVNWSSFTSRSLMMMASS